MVLIFSEQHCNSMDYYCPVIHECVENEKECLNKAILTMCQNYSGDYNTERWEDDEDIENYKIYINYVCSDEFK